MGKLLPLTLAIACNAELILDGGDDGWSQWYRSVDGVMDPSDSKAAAAAPGEDSEEPLQVV